MKRFVLILAGLLLASCVAPPAGPQGKVLSAAERAECLMQGGTVGRGGLLPDELCFRPEPDGTGLSFQQIGEGHFVLARSDAALREVA